MEVHSHGRVSTALIALLGAGLLLRLLLAYVFLPQSGFYADLSNTEQIFGDPAMLVSSKPKGAAPGSSSAPPALAAPPI